jgi:hypothetical protein
MQCFVLAITSTSSLESFDVKISQYHWRLERHRPKSLPQSVRLILLGIRAVAVAVDNVADLLGIAAE